MGLVFKGLNDKRDMYTVYTSAFCQGHALLRDVMSIPSGISGIIYGINIFLSIDWLKVCHVIKNKLTILKKLGQSHK